MHIENVVIENTTGYGLSLDQTVNSMLMNLTINGTGSHGVILNHCTNLQIIPPFTLQDIGAAGISVSYSDLILR